MRKFVYAIAGAALLGAGAGAQQAGTPATPRAPSARPALPRPAASHPAPGTAVGLSVESQNQLVKQYCSGCHSEKGRAGGLSLISFEAAKVDTNAETAEKMIRKLRAGMMP